MKFVLKALFVALATLLILVSCGDVVERVADYVQWDPEYTKTWAPQVGSTLPDLTVKDGIGQARTFGTLTGEQGLLIFFVRSTNW